jgi:type IV pilus assembly protein PilQ
MTRRLNAVVVLLVVAWCVASSQQRAARQEEIVSLKSDVTYSQAITVLSEISKRMTAKPIVDPAPLDNVPIGINIESKHWLEALQMILARAGKTFREESDYFLIQTTRSASATAGEPGVAATAAPAGTAGGKEAIGIDSREVLITTIFFSLDVDKSQSLGIDWSLTWLKGRDSLAVDLSAGARSALELRYARPYRYGDILAAIQAFALSGVGEVISSPRIIVRSSETGRVQVGQDISVTERTIGAGGQVTTSVRQIPTGTIVTVKPQILKEGNIDYVYLELEIERSSALTTGDLPTIDRNSTKTSLLLVDGEEVFLSGLYFNQESVVRTGVPFLKDLPWWFFGLRYIFGSDERRTLRRELAILMKAEIVPSLRERAAQKVRESALELQRRKFEQDLERLRTKPNNEKN